MRRETRTAAQVREHYEVERELARRLRGATREERRALYTELYDQLFRRVPHHPLLARKADPAERARRTGWALRLLGRFLRPDTVFLELGPGDCALAFAVAARVARVYAVDVSSEITRSASPPANFELRLSDGASVPVAAGSVTLAYSNQLMEHLHPDDALEQLRGVARALAPGGAYVCITPNRLCGPHDVSRHFDPVATGFHLREYTAGELGALFREVGFARLVAYAGGRGRYLRCPLGVIRAFEALVARLPAAVARPLARSLPGQAMLGITLVGIK